MHPGAYGTRGVTDSEQIHAAALNTDLEITLVVRLDVGDNATPIFDRHQLIGLTYPRAVNELAEDFTVLVQPNIANDKRDFCSSLIRLHFYRQKKP